MTIYDQMVAAYAEKRGTATPNVEQDWNVPLNFVHYQERIREFSGEEISKETFMNQLREKLATTNIEQVKEDVIGFVDNPHELDIWSNDYFLQLADRMVFKE